MTTVDQNAMSSMAFVSWLSAESSRPTMDFVDTGREPLADAV